MERKWYILTADMFDSIDWSKTLISKEQAYWRVDKTEFIFPMAYEETYLNEVCCAYDDFYTSRLLLDDAWGNVIM